MTMDDIDRLAELFARVKRLEDAAAMPILPYSSLDDASVPEKDATGSVKSVWGRQWDGTHGFADLSGPKPPKPTVPIVASRPGGVDITWDGGFQFDEVAPMDFARVEVHVSSNPDAYESLGRDTIVATIESAMGGTVSVRLPDTPVHYVWLVTRTRAGVGSDHAPDADEVEAYGLPIPDASQITAIQEALNGKNRIIHSPNDPDPEMDGLVDGDTWFKHSVAGVIGQWRWDGSDWVAQEITSDVIANLEVGKLLTGTISAGQRIIAGDENGSRVELDEHGMRKYADDGVSLDVVLDEDGALFSGRVVSSDIIGGSFKTALTGKRIEISAQEQFANNIMFRTPSIGDGYGAFSLRVSDPAWSGNEEWIDFDIGTLLYPPFGNGYMSLPNQIKMRDWFGPNDAYRTQMWLNTHHLVMRTDVTPPGQTLKSEGRITIETADLNIMQRATVSASKRTFRHSHVVVVDDTSATADIYRTHFMLSEFGFPDTHKPVLLINREADEGQRLSVMGVTYNVSTYVPWSEKILTDKNIATEAQTVAGLRSDVVVTPIGLRARLNAAPTWTTPSFTNGWGQFNPSTYPVAYTKINGVVYLRGLISGGTVGASAFTLPAGYRPSTDSVFQSFAGTSGTLGRLNILANGQVVAVTAGMDGWTSLFVASFPAAV